LIQIQPPTADPQIFIPTCCSEPSYTIIKPSQAGLKIGNMKEPPSLQGPQYGTFQKQQLKVFTTLHSSRNLSNCPRDAEELDSKFIYKLP